MIDVGCAVGSFASGWLRGRDVAVYAFEPHPWFYQELKKWEAKEPRFKVFPYAVCDKDGEADFYINDNAVTSSLRPFADEQKWFHTIGVTHVQTRRLETFCREMGITSIRLLKSDAQGSDLDVLLGLGQMLSVVEEIIVEAFITAENMYVGEEKKEDVYNFLIPNGFALVAQNNDGNYADLTFRRR